MNNKPVAWMYQDGEVILSKPLKDEVGIPLYTHPVKEHDLGISHAIGFDDGFKAGMQRAVEMNVVKELTDEEILREWVDATYLDASQCTDDIKDFARAILRKASEK